MRVGGGMKLRNPKELMQLWVTAYTEKLRPKLLLGRFDAIEGLDTHGDPRTIEAAELINDEYLFRYFGKD